MLKSAGGTVLIIAAILAGSVVAGLAAAAGGRFIEILWTLPGSMPPPVGWPVGAGSAHAAKTIADTSPMQREVRRAIARADRLSPVEADRPTWIGDRLRACRVRIERAYGLDLDAAWPRLWLIVPDTARTELARPATPSAPLPGSPHGPLVPDPGIWWWPAAPIALIIGATAISKARERPATWPTSSNRSWTSIAVIWPRS